MHYSDFEALLLETETSQFVTEATVLGRELIEVKIIARPLYEACLNSSGSKSYISVFHLDKKEMFKDSHNNSFPLDHNLNY